MRPSIVAVGVVVFIGCGLTQDAIQPVPSVDIEARSLRERLEPFFDQDIRRLAKSSKIELVATLNECRPTKVPLGNYEPWYLCRYDESKGKSAIVLFCGYGLCQIPGQSFAAIELYDENVNRMFTERFSTGWRLDIHDAQLKSDHNLNGVVIEVRSGFFLGPDIAKQVYGVIDNRVGLIRLEDSKGNPVSNIYRSPNLTIGPLPPKRSAQEWEYALESQNKMIILESLVWLGGEHRRNLSHVLENGIENLESAQLVAVARARPRVRAAVQELTRSENRWI